MEAGLEAARYVECGTSQEKAMGWTELRGEANGVLVESVAGQIVLKFMVEVNAMHKMGMPTAKESASLGETRG
jgi:recombination associated protein RdgC